MSEDRYAKYKDFEGPNSRELAEALSKWNGRKVTLAQAIASQIVCGGQQPHTSQRLMKHKTRMAGVRVK